MFFANGQNMLYSRPKYALNHKMFEMEHNLAGNKAYLGRARMTRWWESVDEPSEFDVGGDGISLAE
jgi:hypothetical protein